MIPKKILDQVEYADLRIFDIEEESLVLENDTITTAAKVLSKTYGARVLKNGAWGLYFSNKKDLIPLFERAIKLAKVSSQNVKKRLKITKISDEKDEVSIPLKKDPFSVSLSDKIKFLRKGEDLVRQDDSIKSVDNRLQSTRIKKEFYNSFGARIIQTYPYVGLWSSAIARDGDIVQRYSNRICNVGGWERLDKSDDLFKEIGEKVLKLLNAESCPAGTFPVVCNPILTGLFFHEAIGHASEADAVINKISVLRDKIGKKVGNELINLSDDANISNSHGHILYDDEGFIGKETPIIKKGILKGYLHSLETSSIMNAQPTGNSRSMSPEYKPIPRMTNIVLKPGHFSFDEIIKSIKNGIYALGFKGGEVDPDKGIFVFSASEAFLVKNGEKVKYLRDVTLSGDILETLKHITMVGNDPVITPGGGFCGKAGQLVPVGEFTPSIKIEKCMVGGNV